MKRAGGGTAATTPDGHVAHFLSSANCLQTGATVDLGTVFQKSAA
jgi:hypothetical protein